MIPHKPLHLNWLLRPMTTLTGGKTQQKNNFPLGVWLSACGLGWNSCYTWAAKPNECHPRTDMTEARVCFRPWFTLVLLTSRSHSASWAGLAVPPVPSAAQGYPRCPPYVVPLPTASPAAKGLHWCLCPRGASQEKNSLIIITWALPSLWTPLTTVNSMEKGSNKSELVQTSPSPPQGLQTHSRYHVEAN